MTLKSLSRQIGALLSKRNQTLAFAESCTGGLISTSVTEIPGSSKYFYGGVISYANQVKQDLLGVKLITLKRHGAVSKLTALEMARGAKRAMKTDWAASVTGIAGPSGGTPKKPVGLVFYAIVGPQVEVVKKHIFKGSRRQIQTSSAEAVLELLTEILDKEKFNGSGR